MEKKEIFSYATSFIGEHTIYGYIYGSPEGEHSAAIVGAMRGTEYQQLYICSLLSEKLAELEESGDIVSGKSIMIIPSINYGAMNASQKFWLSDNSDLNRAFPGNPEGPATSRLAHELLTELRTYLYGIQFPSFYMRGKFIPHVRMMKSSRQSVNLANLFGLPFVMTGESRSYDERTLHYNWQEAGTEAFAIYSGGTDRLDRNYARYAVAAVLRFLSRMGIIRYNSMGGNVSENLAEDEMESIKSEAAGFLGKRASVSDEVSRGDIIAKIIDPLEGRVLQNVRAPYSGIIFYAQDDPMVYQNVVIYKMIRKLHL